MFTKINNQKKTSQMLAIFLILSMIFMLTACNKDNNQNSDDNNQNNQVNNSDNQSDVQEETTEEQSPIPKDVTFNGEEIRILNCSYFTEASVFFNATEEIGEIVNDALYKRNSKIQSDLNVNFKISDISLYAGDNMNQMVKNSVMAGSDDYDILIGVQYHSVQMAADKMYANLLKFPYIDLEQAWWPTNYIKEMTIGNESIYFLTGDISLNFIRNMSCAYFNKQVYSQNFGDPDEMYKLVLDGKWTIDKLSEMSRVMYKDINGDGAYDDADQYGCGVMTMNLTDHFTYDAGVRVTARDDEGLPYFVMNSERTVNFTEKIHSLFFANEGVRVFPASDTTNHITIPEKFMNNELLFDFGWFYISELLRDMKSDYGIIPFPKYDESQPEYLSLAHDIGPVFCVPITCIKEDAVGAVLEAMAFESYRSVLPAYFEIALKLKYVRDTGEDAFTIIDMIHDNVTTDFAYVYNYAVNSIGLIMRELLAAKNSNFVSRFERLEPRAQTSLDKLVDLYMNGAE